jgi:HAD superfamily hydrolase (TIGR01549 family)
VVRRAANANGAPPELRAVLIDIDGTLIDSNEAHARAWADVLKQRGWPEMTWQQVLPLVGMGGDKLLPELIGVAAESAQGKKLSKERTAWFMATYAPTLRAFPKVRELFEALRARGIKRVIATSAGEEELDVLLRAAGIADLLSDQTTKDDAGGKSKPDPNIIVAALEKAGARADEAVMLGDTPYDVEAATKAGVRTIAVRSGGWGDEKLRGAAAIYADVGELLDRIEESPLGRHWAGGVEQSPRA